MKEYMFYIFNTGDGKAAMNSETHLAFVKSCEVYIGELQAKGKLIAAQPIVREGIRLRKSNEGWNQETLDIAGEIQVGYYHIRAENMEDALEMAKRNPEFEYVPSVRIDIRPIKTKEAITDFEYPK